MPVVPFSRRRIPVIAVVVLLVLAVLVALRVQSNRSSDPGDAGPTPVESLPSAVVVDPEPVGTPEVMPEQPNVVLVMADDMRVDDLAFAPNLRGLIAEHGLSFENSFSPFPLCCPARASFLTGQYAHNHEVYWHDPPWGYGAFDDSRSIATSLKDAGYRTGFIGKYLNRYGQGVAKATGKPSLTHVPAGWDDWRAAVEPPGDSAVPGHTYHYTDTPFNVNGEIDASHRGEYQSDVIGDFSVAMAKRFGRGADPFFMYVNYVAPHHGLPDAPNEPRDVLDAEGHEVSVATPATPARVFGLFDEIVDRPSGVATTAEPIESDLSDKPKVVRKRSQPFGDEALDALRTVTRLRAEAVFVMDENIGRLVEQLKASGEWSRTVFAFTSDNGMILGEHGLAMSKIRAYEPSLRVPMLITGPGLRSGEKRYDPITTVDLNATILDLADARPSHRPDGLSRVAALTADQGWSTPVVTEAVFTSPGKDPAFTDQRTTIGIRVSRYSYTRYRDGTTELYDLVTDPRQDDNVADRPEYAEVRAALDELWPRIKDCRGRAECGARLPELLGAGPEQNTTDTETYWAEIRQAYGWGS